MNKAFLDRLFKMGLGRDELWWWLRDVFDRDPEDGDKGMVLVQRPHHGFDQLVTKQLSHLRASGLEIYFVLRSPTRTPHRGIAAGHTRSASCWAHVFFATSALAITI